MFTHLPSVTRTFKKYPLVLYSLIGFISVFAIALAFVFTSVVEIKALELDKQFVTFSKDETSMKWAATFFKPNLKGPIHWWHDVATDPYLVYLLLLISFVFALINKHKYALIYLLSFLFIL